LAKVKEFARALWICLSAVQGVEEIPAAMTDGLAEGHPDMTGGLIFCFQPATTYLSAKLNIDAP
jgi:hypothetical protein